MSRIWLISDHQPVIVRDTALHTGAGAARPAGDFRLYRRCAPPGLLEGARTGDAMAKIEGEIVIGRPVDVVFDYVAEQVNEPRYNPRMVLAEKITAGPVGKGSRFHSTVASHGRTADMLIECTGYDRPRLVRTVITMAQADIDYTLRFQPVPAGTLMRWHGQVRPKGWLRLLDPVIAWLGRRQERRIWAALKQHMETAAEVTGAAPATAGADRRRR